MLALLVVVVVAVGAVAVLFGRPVQGRGGYDATQRAKRVAIVLMIGAAILLVLGFTQFRFLREDVSAGTIVLTLDVSESMSRDDVEPTRLRAAKDAAEAFLDGLSDDFAVGLTVFSSSAEVLVPPSASHEMIAEALVGLPRGEGTLIGDGLAAALGSIEGRWARDGEGPAAIVLLSDGRDTGSVVTPDDAAERAAELEVPVYTVVVGQHSETEGKGADVELMARIAGATDGESFTATTASGLIDVYERLQRQLAVELTIGDLGAWFVGTAGALAIAATIAILYTLRSEF